ncbi:MAG: RNA 2',3'-cyclic phosphodiesterase [Syntrophorhabdaceae bacterium]|nr:RNA 2',3'-cyclic phosphodiesterase [Syntrophorhabdaceae bacterium]
MRAFLAIGLPDEIKVYLGKISGHIGKYVEGVKWVNREGQHITLKFLGEIEEKAVWGIKEALSFIGMKYRPFKASLGSIDGFPDKKRTRVIVIRLENGVDKICDIYNDIENSVGTLGFEKEDRPFTPHITLGRRKTPAPLLEKACIETERLFFDVDSIVLFKSTLRPDGAVYTPLWKMEFKGGL